MNKQANNSSTRSKRLSAKAIALLALGATFLTLIGLCLVIYQKGKNRYSKALIEARDLGMPASWADYQSSLKRIPDSENFCKHPVFLNDTWKAPLSKLKAAMKDGQSNNHPGGFDPRLLYIGSSIQTANLDTALKQFAEQQNQHSDSFKQLREALARPQFDAGALSATDTSDSNFDLLRVAQIISLANLEFQLGNLERGQKDYLDLLKIISQLNLDRNRPNLINLVIRSACQRAIIHHLSATSPEKHWTSESLAQMAQILAAEDIKEDLIEALHLESLFLIELSGSGDPKKINQVVNSGNLPGRIYLHVLAKPIEQNNHVIKTLQAKPSLNHSTIDQLQAPENSRIWPISQFDRMGDSLCLDLIPQVINIQSIHDQLSIVIALMRYKNQTGNWPAALDALIPTYLEKIPLNLTTGKTFSYHLNPKGLPRLDISLPERPAETWGPLSTDEMDQYFQQQLPK